MQSISYCQLIENLRSAAAYGKRTVSRNRKFGENRCPRGADACPTGSGKTHLAIAIASCCIRSGARGRFFNVVDLVNRLEAEARSGRRGRMADYLTQKDFAVLDELGYVPFAQSGGQLLFYLISRLYEHNHRHHQPRFRRMAQRLR